MKEAENKRRDISLGEVIKRLKSDGLTDGQRELITILERVGRQYGLHFGVSPDIYQLIKGIYREGFGGGKEVDYIFNLLVNRQGRGSSHNSEIWLSKKAVVAEGKTIEGHHGKRRIRFKKNSSGGKNG